MTEIDALATEVRRAFDILTKGINGEAWGITEATQIAFMEFALHCATELVLVRQYEDQFFESRTKNEIHHHAAPRVSARLHGSRSRIMPRPQAP